LDGGPAIQPFKILDLSIGNVDQALAMLSQVGHPIMHNCEKPVGADRSDADGDQSTSGLMSMPTRSD
jgi:hypothetical protein